MRAAGTGRPSCVEVSPLPLSFRRDAAPCPAKRRNLRICQLSHPSQGGGSTRAIFLWWFPGFAQKRRVAQKVGKLPRKAILAVVRALARMTA